MKKYLKILLILLFIILIVLADWSALHQILKSNEDNYTKQYLILCSSIVILGIAGYLFIIGWVNKVKIKKG